MSVVDPSRRERALFRYPDAPQRSPHLEANARLKRNAEAARGMNDPYADLENY